MYSKKSMVILGLGKILAISACIALSALIVLSAVSSMVWAQQDLQGRSLEKFKERVITMTKQNRRPFTGIPIEDAEVFLSRFNQANPDLWGAEWIKLGEPHEAKGRELIRQGRTTEGRDEIVQAARYYFAGRFPATSSPQKLESYKRELKAIMEASPHLEFPIERITIPFRGTRGNEIVGYLQLPKGEGKHPLVIFCGGIDSWKEERIGETMFYLRKGLATFSMDLPGTGESPIYNSPDAQTVFSAAIDYFQTRSDIDSKKIGMVGISAGGYYGAKMAFVEKNRLKASVDQAGPIHYSNQRQWQERSSSTQEYLMDFHITRAAMYGLRLWKNITRPRKPCHSRTRVISELLPVPYWRSMGSSIRFVRLKMSIFYWREDRLSGQHGSTHWDIIWVRRILQ